MKNMCKERPMSDAEYKRNENFVSCFCCKLNGCCSSTQYGLGCHNGVEDRICLKKYEVLFADFDDTLIHTNSGLTFPKGIWDMSIRFDVFDKIKELKPKYVLIISNQGGIESGFVNEGRFKSKLDYIGNSIKEYCGVENVYAMYCTTNDKSDKYRKPNIGMVELLLEKYVGDDFEHIKTKTLMIGDASGKAGQFSDSDKKTAENFGCDYLDVDDFLLVNFDSK